MANKTLFEERVQAAAATATAGGDVSALQAEARRAFSNSRNEAALNDVVVINLRSGREDGGEYGLPSGSYTLGFNLYLNGTAGSGEALRSEERLVAWDVLRVQSKNSFSN